MNYRRPIISVLGHVDHGKTELLDTIRDTNSQDYESGGITQHVKVANLPIETIKKLNPSISDEIQIPGFVWIDTPGHGAFTLARQQGGQFSDIAVLVVDATSGIQPQTEESIQILKNNKTPFIVALNKIDKLSGWNNSIENSSARFEDELNESIYEVAGDLHEFGINANRYSEISNFAENVAIIPISAKENYGINNLSQVLVGLTQQYMTDKISISDTDSSRGVILDITEEKGFGTVADILIYEGVLQVKDELYSVKNKKSNKYQVNSILKTDDISNSTTASYESINEASAAMFVRVQIDQIDELEPGDILTEEISDESTNTYQIDTDDDGLVVCADTLGSLSAIVQQLRESDVNVSEVNVGNVNKYAITQAMTMPKKEHNVVVGFNVNVTEKAQELSDKAQVKIINNTVIHDIVEEYEEYHKSVQKSKEAKASPPGEFQIMDSFIFNRSNPAIVGVKVLRGEVHKGCQVVTGVSNYDSNPIGEINQIEVDGESVEFVEKGDEASIEIKGATVGRDFNNNDKLISRVPENNIKMLSQKHADELEMETLDLINEIKEQQQEIYPFWGQ